METLPANRRREALEFTGCAKGPLKLTRKLAPALALRYDVGEDS